MRAGKSKCDSEIEKLCEKIAKDAKPESVTEINDEDESLLADISAPEIQEAIVRVNSCRARYESLSEEWTQETSKFGKAVIDANIVRQVIDETTGKPTYQYGSDTEMDKAVQEQQIAQKHEEVLKAIEDLTEAQKNLDALIKKRKKRNYKKNRKKATRETNSSDQEKVPA